MLLHSRKILKNRHCIRFVQGQLSLATPLCVGAVSVRASYM